MNTLTRKLTMNVWKRIEGLWPLVWKSSYQKACRRASMLEGQLASETRRADYYRQEFINAGRVVRFPEISFNPDWHDNFTFGIRTISVRFDTGKVEVRYPLPQFKIETIEAAAVLAKAGWAEVETRLKEQFQKTCEDACRLALADGSPL